MGERKPLGKKVRFEVFKRDGFTCVYCGSHPPNVILHCDHVVAVANGGGNDIDNLVTSCDACNFGKGARALTSIPKTLEQKAQVLREREEQIIAFNQLLADKRDRIEQSAWIIAESLLAAWGEEPGHFRSDWFSSIERFVDALDIDEMIDAVQVATGKFRYNQNKCFRYFCGVCWRKIRRAQDGED
jgi:hypothetical protein